MNAMDLSGMRRADRVICSARAYRDLLRRYGISGSRVAYVPWGLDLAAITPRSSPSAFPNGSVGRVGFIGRIEPRKGQLELIHGFARYLRHAPSARLELVGPSADRDYAARIRQTIRSLGLERQVSMTGHVPHPYRRLVRWDLFVSLSSDEGQGLAVLEAMAAGVPVLSLLSAGVEDYLEDGVNGWVCPDVSPATVAGAIRRAVTDPRQSRIVARARRMIHRRYAWSRTVSAIDRLYRS
jgi:glycosyltransferase involved in cell wall biosynthesis